MNTTPGLLASAAVLLVSEYARGDHAEPYTRMFPVETLPEEIHKHLDGMDAVIVTVAAVKRSRWTERTGDVSREIAAAEMVNRMRDEFGLREKFE